MDTILLAILILHLTKCASEKCLDGECQFVSGRNCPVLSWSEISNCNNNTLNLSNKTIIKVTTSSNSSYQTLTKLDMSHNKIEDLPQDFLYNAVKLEEVNLTHNMLKKLPEQFLRNSSSLKILSLEGNPLLDIPFSVFHPSLHTLTVDCICTIAKDIEQGNHSFKCQDGKDLRDINKYYETECRTLNLLALYVVISIVVAALIVGGVIYYIWQQKKHKANFENKDVLENSPSHGQQRYMTRNQDCLPPASNQLTSHTQDYENIVVGQWQAGQAMPYTPFEEHGQQSNTRHGMKEEDIYLESDVTDGDQPIYTNTQNVYYSYMEPGPDNDMNKEDDDVYILPDH